MVRFKNRYFLLELIPFEVEQVATDQQQTTKDLRYHSSANSSSEAAKTLVALPPFTSASVSSCIRASLALNYGQFASSSLLQSLSVKYSNSTTNMIILRVPRDFQAQIWASLTFLTDWPAENPAFGNSFRCTWRTVHCAGTIRSCQKAAISFARQIILRSAPNVSDEVLEPLAKKIKTIDP